MVGKKLRQLRAEKNLKQTELAKILNLSKQTISAYEKDWVTPPADTLERIADFFNVTVDCLLGRSDSAENGSIVSGASRDFELPDTLPAEARQQIIDYAEYVIEKHKGN